MDDPLAANSDPLGEPMQLAMAEPPELPPSGKFPSGKTPPSQFLEWMPREPGGAPRPTVKASAKGEATTSVGGARVGYPDIGAPRQLQQVTNMNEPRTTRAARAAQNFAEQQVLQKLIALKDFRPQINQGRLNFRSLTPEENEMMNSIGFGRAPNVTYADEMAEGQQSAWAWEQNLRHWLSLSGPK